jgi:hypothetical protein
LGGKGRCRSTSWRCIRNRPCCRNLVAASRPFDRVNGRRDAVAPVQVIVAAPRPRGIFVSRATKALPAVAMRTIAAPPTTMTPAVRRYLFRPSCDIQRVWHSKNPGPPGGAQSEKCIRASSATRSTSAGAGLAPTANCATCKFGPWAANSDICSFVTGCTT